MRHTTGVLLINLGSPAEPSTRAVRAYLREFLSDPKVLDLPALGRWLLLNLVILPTRPRRTAALYRKIWTERGSPLVAHTQDLATAVQSALDARRPDMHRVAIAMRYGRPSIEAALREFDRLGVGRIVVAPLYPQFATSSFGSSVARVYELAGRLWNSPSVEVLPPFFDEPGYVTVLAESLERALGDSAFDHLLFSFHGIPERHISKSYPAGGCLTENCCDQPGGRLAYCYRAQCHATARLVAEALGLDPARWSVSFQSRLGRTPWIRPFTDEVLPELASRGARVAMASPSFTADCLETLEELAISGREQFLAAGGASFSYLPCLNSSPGWVAYLTDRIAARTGS